MKPSQSSLLRGSLFHFSESGHSKLSSASFGTVVPRWLRDAQPEAAGDQTVQAEDAEGFNFVLLFMSIFLGMFILGFFYCVVLTIQNWLCYSGSPELPEEVNQGMLISNMSSEQRRAALEAIFSETSKPAINGNKKRRKLRRMSRSKQENDEENPLPDVVPVTPVTQASAPESMSKPSLDDFDDESEESNHQSTFDTEEQGEDATEVKAETKEGNMSAETQTVDGVSPCPLEGTTLKQDSVDSRSSGDVATVISCSPASELVPAVLPALSLPDSQVSIANSSAPSLGISTMTDSTFDPSIRRSMRWTHRDDEETEGAETDVKIPPTGGVVLPVFHDNEERSDQPSPSCSKDEWESTTAESESGTDEDDETEENVCPICLSGYDGGELLISSKHCSHVFHKECIFEWLEKHNVCPCCRVDMVTEGEIEEAATSLGGSTSLVGAATATQADAPPTPVVSNRHRISSPTRSPLPQGRSPLRLSNGASPRASGGASPRARRR